MIEIGPCPRDKSEFKDDDLVCYCFGYTKKDIEKDYLDNSRSLIYEKIVFEKKSSVSENFYISGN